MLGLRKKAPLTGSKIRIKQTYPNKRNIENKSSKSHLVLTTKGSKASVQFVPVLHRLFGNSRRKKANRKKEFWTGIKQSLQDFAMATLNAKLSKVSKITVILQLFETLQLFHNSATFSQRKDSF